MTLCHFVGGPHDGLVGEADVSYFPTGQIRCIMTTINHPNHVLLYEGAPIFAEDEPIVLEFAGYETKDLARGR